MEFSIKECGTHDEQVRCEAGGSPRTRAMNVIHYRAEEAKKLQGAGDKGGCQKAALEAIAVVRGNLKSLSDWTLPDPRERYLTRFDGLLTKAEMIAKMKAFGKQAEDAYASCGGPTPIKTSSEDEESYHARW